MGESANERLETSCSAAQHVPPSYQSSAIEDLHLLLLDDSRILYVAAYLQQTRASWLTNLSTSEIGAWASTTPHPLSPT
jgi:hypothetical protein